MSFIRTRTINGRQYQSMEWRWREGGKVRSRSVAVSKSGSFDDNRSLHGHSSEVEDMMQSIQSAPPEKSTSGDVSDVAEPSETEASDEGNDSSHTSVGEAPADESDAESEQDGGTGDNDGEGDL